MDKAKKKKKEAEKGVVQNEKLVSLLAQIRGELVKIKEELQKQMVE